MHWCCPCLSHSHPHRTVAWNGVIPRSIAKSCQKPRPTKNNSWFRTFRWPKQKRAKARTEIHWMLIKALIINSFVTYFHISRDWYPLESRHKTWVKYLNVNLIIILIVDVQNNRKLWQRSRWGAEEWVCRVCRVCRRPRLMSVCGRRCQAVDVLFASTAPVERRHRNRIHLYNLYISLTLMTVIQRIIDWTNDWKTDSLLINNFVYNQII